MSTPVVPVMAATVDHICDSCYVLFNFTWYEIRSRFSHLYGPEKANIVLMKRLKQRFFKYKSSIQFPDTGYSMNCWIVIRWLKLFPDIECTGWSLSSQKPTIGQFCSVHFWLPQTSPKINSNIITPSVCCLQISLGC